MSKTCYLVDYENVHEQGLEKLHALSEDDHIYLFYTSNANKIGLDYLKDVQARLIPISVAPGKQSLDMHLVSFLGYLLGSERDHDTRYVILSKDTDYVDVGAYWNERLVMPEKVSRSVSIAQHLSPDSAFLRGLQSAEKLTSQERRQLLRTSIRSAFRSFAEPDAWGVQRIPVVKLINLLTQSDAFNQERELSGKKVIPFLEECFPDVLRVGIENGGKYFFEVMSDEAKVSAEAVASDDTESIRQKISLILRDSAEYDTKGRQRILLAALCGSLCNDPAYVKALKASGKKAAVYLRETFSDVLYIEKIRDVHWAYAAKELPASITSSMEVCQPKEKARQALEQGEARTAEKDVTDSQPSSLRQKLLMCGLDPVVIDDVAQILDAYPGVGNAKIQLYNRLRKALGAKPGTETYHRVIDAIAG